MCEQQKNERKQYFINESAFTHYHYFKLFVYIFFFFLWMKMCTLSECKQNFVTRARSERENNRYDSSWEYFNLTKGLQHKYICVSRSDLRIFHENSTLQCICWGTLHNLKSFKLITLILDTALWATNFMLKNFKYFKHWIFYVTISLVLNFIFDI